MGEWIGTPGDDHDLVECLDEAHCLGRAKRVCLHHFRVVGKIAQYRHDAPVQEKPPHDGLGRGDGEDDLRGPILADESRRVAVECRGHDGRGAYLTRHEERAACHRLCRVLADVVEPEEAAHARLVFGRAFHGERRWNP